MQTSQEQAKLCPEEKNDKQLLEEDDAVRALLLDSVLGFESSKCCYDHKRFPESAKKHVRSLLKARVFLKNTHDIDNMILKIFQMHFRGNIKRISIILQNYLQLFDIDSGVTVMPCHNYKMEENVGAKLVATKNLKTGEILELHNFSTQLSDLPDTLKLYSVTESKGTIQKLWLGPCSIANHSCNSNACYYTTEKGKVLIEVKTPISVGEEITVNYNKSYFGNDCECSRCKNPPENNMFVIGKRNRGPVDYNCNHAGQNAPERYLAFVIFSKMFKDVEYPDALKTKALEAERKYWGDSDVIQSDDIQKMNSAIKNFVLPLIRRIQNGAKMTPELEEFESDLLKKIVESQAQLAHSVQLITAKKQPRNYLEPLEVIGETMRNLQKDVSDMHRKARTAMEKTIENQGYIDAKVESRKRNMAKMNITEGNCDLLPEVAQLRRAHKKMKKEGKANGKQNRIHSQRSSTDFDEDDDSFQDPNGTSCPKMFKEIFNDILDGEHN